jgi:hypothetical protein
VKRAIVKIPAQAKPLFGEGRRREAAGQPQCPQAIRQRVRNDFAENQVVRSHPQLVEEEQTPLHLFSRYRNGEHSPDREPLPQPGAERLARPVPEPAGDCDEATRGQLVEKVGMLESGGHQRAECVRPFAHPPILAPIPEDELEPRLLRFLPGEQHPRCPGDTRRPLEH